IFRVRAVNSHGISKPSRMSDAIAALDPTEFGKLHAKKLGGKLEVVSFDDDVEVSAGRRCLAARQHSGPHSIALRTQSLTWQRANSISSEFCLPISMETVSLQSRLDPSRLRSSKVIATRETDTSVLIQWAPPKEPNNLIGYYIDQCVKGSKDWMSANHKPHNSTKFVVSGLTKGETYVFRVQAINELGLSEESQESAPITVKAALTPPSAPYDISLLSCDGHSMLLTWKKPLLSGGSNIKEYYVDKRRSGTTMWREVHIPPISERVYKVEGLTEGAVYQFQVYAANLAGLGPASKHSDDFACEGWTMPEPGPAYDLSLTEVRDHSMVVEWKKPVYTGSGPVTGYHVEYCKTGTSEWTTATETAVHQRFFKVTGLEEGVNYEFRVRGVNDAGVGMVSMPSDPMTAKALAGSQEVSCTVDKKTGDIVLSFESCVMNQESQFIWKKDYKEITDFSKGVVVKTEGNTSKLIFKNAEKEDFGVYSVSVTNTDGVSSSYGIYSEEMTKMLALSYDIRHPIIPLKAELAYKILERGRVRFWLQAEEISPNVTYKFFANNKELSGADPNKMGHDVSTGIIEFILDHFTEENEGTFTCQITDGGGKAQSSLVLIGDTFKAALSEADYQRREYIRVKEGPHFSEFLSLQVGDDCSVTLVCKVANLKKESEFHWFKEDAEIIPDVKPDLGSGVCKLPIKLVCFFFYPSAAKVDFLNKVHIRIILLLSYLTALQQSIRASAAELVINCTATGIQLQCHMKYYTSEMNITWYHGETKLLHSDKFKIGGTPSMATMEVIEPTEKDQGTYSIVIVDPENSHKRTLNLSGEVYEKAHAEFLQLNLHVCVCLDRGKVVGGLPDVVTIMEKKTLSLTCTVCGDPKPQVSWLKSGAEVEPDDKVYTLVLNLIDKSNVNIRIDDLWPFYFYCNSSSFKKHFSFMQSAVDVC
ncbi:unnamed protein product, partial [Tetraodon nigroviridis]